MPTVSDVLDVLGRRMSWQKAAGWDPVGLQVGDPRQPARRVALCHEVTEAVMSEVEQTRPDLLITYHPLLFKPTTRLLAGSSPVGRALRLVRVDVAVAVVHTSFDVAVGGGSDALADCLNLNDCRPFGPVEPGGATKIVTFVPENASERVAAAMSEAGGGRIGNYSGCSFRSAGFGTFRPEPGAAPFTGEQGVDSVESEVRVEMVVPAAQKGAVISALLTSHPYEEPAFDVYNLVSNFGMAGRAGVLDTPIWLSEFAGRVAERLGAKATRVAGSEAKPVARIAVVPGSGAEFIAAAVEVGADVLITGDVSHHQAHLALDQGLSVIDAGHAATERPGIGRLGEWVRSSVEEMVDLTAFDPSPWRAV